MGSTQAYLALVLWVPVTLVLFATLRPTNAVLATVLGAMLLLPEGVEFDASGLPRFHKYSIATLCAFSGMLVTDWRRVRQAKLGRGLELLGLIAALAMIGTVGTNSDALTYGPIVLPSLTPHDIISVTVRTLTDVVFPFCLGRCMFRSREDVHALLHALTIAGLAYAPLILLELRLSPRLHIWVYGYFQHDWVQVKRQGGFRPLVFLPHGLALAMFVYTSATSAWVLVRSRINSAGWLVRANAYVSSVLLFLLNSLGAAVYGLATIPLALFGSARLQVRVATFLACVVLTYPVLRATGTFPTEGLVNLAARISQDRAASLAFRFENENLLLEKAAERPIFGWGGFSRSRVFDERGRDLTVIDGAWIAYLGTTGGVGLAARFGLLLVPIFVAARRTRGLARPDKLLLAGLGILVAVSVVDLLPNGIFTPLPFLLAGALAGATEHFGSSAQRRQDAGEGMPQLGLSARIHPPIRPASTFRQVDEPHHRER